MDRYDVKMLCAYIRGAAKRGVLRLSADLTDTPLEELSPRQIELLLQAGQDAELKLYHFKKKELLPRVKTVLGYLKGIGPESLLDVGSGRGVFLFPFLQEFPWVPVTSVDLLSHRVQMLQDVASGGVENLTAKEENICTCEGENLYDVVTLLEVLEHIPDVQASVDAAVRLAKRYVIVSVPSKPDNNPEHIHLLTKDLLSELFANAGCTKLQFGGVNGHLIMMATIE